MLMAVFSRIGSYPRPRWKIFRLAAQAVVWKSSKPKRSLLLSRWWPERWGCGLGHEGWKISSAARRPMDRGTSRRASNRIKQVRVGRGMALQGLWRQDADQVLYPWSGRVINSSPRIQNLLERHYTLYSVQRSRNPRRVTRWVSVIDPLWTTIC